MTTLYKLTPTSLRSWSITSESNKVVIEHGDYHGKKQVEVLDFPSEERAVFEMDRRVSIKRTKQGYTTFIPTTVPDLPMLVSEYNPAKLPSMVAIQPKLDGIRCVASRNEMMTRRGEPIHSLPHLKQALQHLPPGIKLDGELYCHGKSFQEHLSIINRDGLHKDFGLINYHVFDIQIPDTSFIDRHKMMEEIVTNLHVACIDSIPYNMAHTSELETIWAPRYKEYEGVIIRDVDAPYLYNERPPTVQKLKWLCSEECKIIDMIAPDTGRSEGAAIFICKLNGVRFKVVPKMPIHLRRQYYQMRHNLIGSWTRVYFEKLSAVGKPLKPRAEGCFRKPDNV